MWGFGKKESLEWTITDSPFKHCFQGDCAQVFNYMLNHVGVCSLLLLEIFHHKGDDKSTLANTKASRVTQGETPKRVK